MVRKQTQLQNTKSTEKTDFVRSFPTSIPAGDIVEKAKRAGLELSAARVHKIRFTEKMKRARIASQTPAIAKARGGADTARVKPAHGTKSAFVLALPPEMSAKEAIAKAKSEGLTLTMGYFYSIRSAAKARPKKGKAPNAAPASEATPPKLQGLRPKTNGSDQGEARLRKLIAEIGLTRTRALLAEVLQAFG